jgi:alpha-D-xyloside xylohydrolase
MKTTEADMRTAFRSAFVLILLAWAGWIGFSCSDPKIQKTRDCVVVRIGASKLKVQVCNPNILRVVLSPSGTFSKRKSLIAEGKWKPVKWKLKRNSNSVEVETGRITARVSLGDGHIAFLDGDGNILLSAAGLDSSSFHPAVVQGEDVFNVKQKFTISDDAGLYGLGQFQDGLMNWRGRDVLLVQANRIAVNPFLVSTNRYGILWDNYSETKFHDGKDRMSFASEVADQIDYTFIHGFDMDEIVAGYRGATGTAPMFPKWAYGYWQSKERYGSSRELLAVAKEFRDRRIPVDALVQDWQYWGGNDNWSGMVWTPDRYPDPKRMIDSLHDAYHVRLMNSIWPAVGMATGLYRELKQKGLVFEKNHWSGGRLVDAYSPKARDIYWKHLNRGLLSVGVDAFWMDATEPELTSSGDPYITEAEIKACGRNALGTFSRYLNPYSLAATGGVFRHWRATTRDKRPFILTRSSFGGQQKNAAATWSGDVGSSWDVFKRQIPAGINFCMSGIPYWTTDIGGFLLDSQGGMYPKEGKEPSGGSDPAFWELYVRWFQFGAFCPVFRAHGTGTPREPWRFGESGSWAYDALLKFDNLRYRLLPYIYSAAWKITRDGYTLMRGLPMDFASDKRTLGIGGQYMFGPSILVCPVTREMFHRTKKLEDFIPAIRLFSTENENGSLRVEFFRGQNLKTRVEDLRMSEIALTWIGSIPEPVMKSDYSVRWTGKILTESKGLYQFVVHSDCGYRLWIKDKLILDRWSNETSSVGTASVALDGNSMIEVRLEHRQTRPGTANFKFEWITPDMKNSRPSDKFWECYLPQSKWIDFWNGGRLDGGRTVRRETPIDIMPLYVKAGSIIPMGPFLQWSDEKPADPVELRIYPGGNAEFNLYEDEGDNLNYEMGSYAVIPIRWDEASQTLTIGRRKGGFPGMLKERTFRVVWVAKNHGIGVGETTDPDRIVRYSGIETKVERRAGNKN